MAYNLPDGCSDKDIENFWGSDMDEERYNKGYRDGLDDAKKQHIKLLNMFLMEMTKQNLSLPAHTIAGCIQLISGD